jgi:hypothetical protein
MAWDFEAEPEFEELLAWMGEFIDHTFGGPRTCEDHAHDRGRLLRDLGGRPRGRRVSAAPGAGPCRLGHRPRRAARVPHPGCHHGHPGAHRPPVVGCIDLDVFRAPFYVRERIDERPVLRSIPEAWAAAPEAGCATLLRGLPDKPIHELFDSRGDLLPASAATIIDRGDAT